MCVRLSKSDIMDPNLRQKKYLARLAEVQAEFAAANPLNPPIIDIRPPFSKTNPGVRCSSCGNLVSFYGGYAEKRICYYCYTKAKEDRERKEEETRAEREKCPCGLPGQPYWINSKSLYLCEPHSAQLYLAVGRLEQEAISKFISLLKASKGLQPES